MRKPWLSYCANVHPFRTLPEHMAQVHSVSTELKNLNLDHFNYGLGAWIPAAFLSESNLHKNLRLLGQTVGAQVFTMNGFPYATFHGEPVKKNVFRPSLNDPRRVQYLKTLSLLLADLIPEGETGSISTLPVGHRDLESVSEQTFMHLTELSEFLVHLYETTGRRIQIGLEMEPDGCLETTLEAKIFFERLYEQSPRSKEFIGVCLDACHLAVNFETASDIADHLQDVLLCKVQVSNALKSKDPKALVRFEDDIYLHQTRVRSRLLNAELRRFGDLGLALKDAQLHDQEEWRVHYHVPIFWQGEGQLGTTQTELKEILALFFGLKPRLKCNHFETETYTYDVLPIEIAQRNLAWMLKTELQWLDHYVGSLTSLDRPTLRPLSPM